MILRSRARESSAARTVFLYGTLWLLIKPQGVFFVFLGGCCPRRTPEACAPGTEQVARAQRQYPPGTNVKSMGRVMRKNTGRGCAFVGPGLVSGSRIAGYGRLRRVVAPYFLGARNPRRPPHGACPPGTEQVACAQRQHPPGNNMENMGYSMCIYGKD